jgi:hypothetical protein
MQKTLIEMGAALAQIFLYDICHLERHIACYMFSKRSVPRGPAVHSHFLCISVMSFIHDILEVHCP